MRVKICLTLLFLLGCVAVLRSLSQGSPHPIEASLNLQEALTRGGEQFAEVVPGRVFQFPADHGPHPAFKTEWWYFTGNLKGDDGGDFGYQLTLFRVGLHPESTDNPSEWSADALMMGHLAVSNPARQSFQDRERFSRASAGLAGFLPEARSIWLEDWEIHRDTGGWMLKAPGDPGLELKLTDGKSPVLQGEGGYSRKGPLASHASYYVSQTHLGTEGALRIGGKDYRVGGLSWFDHEWSSQSLAEGLVGWDWFSLQLSDDTELMLYLLRAEDGRVEGWSSGSLVDAEGGKTDLHRDDFQVEATDFHQAPSGATYPCRWTIKIPSKGLDLQVAPTMLNQELSTRVTYWEGAVKVTGARGGRPLEGAGFVELTGYATSGEKSAVR